MWFMLFLLLPVRESQGARYSNYPAYLALLYVYLDMPDILDTMTLNVNLFALKIKDKYIRKGL